MTQKIRNIIVSSKVSEEEFRRMEKAKHVLYEKGEIARNTISSFIAVASNKYANETLGEKSKDDTPEIDEKILELMNRIHQLEMKNTDLTRERKNLQMRCLQLKREKSSLFEVCKQIIDAFTTLNAENQCLKERLEYRNYIKECMEAATLGNII